MQSATIPEIDSAMSREKKPYKKAPGGCWLPQTTPQASAEDHKRQRANYHWLRQLVAVAVTRSLLLLADQCHGPSQQGRSASLWLAHSQLPAAQFEAPGEEVDPKLMGD